MKWTELDRFKDLMLPQVAAMEERIRLLEEKCANLEGLLEKERAEVQIYVQDNIQLMQKIGKMQGEIDKLEDGMGEKLQTIFDRQQRWDMLKTELQDFLNLPPFAYVFGYTALRKIYDGYFGEHGGQETSEGIL